MVSAARVSAQSGRAPHSPALRDHAPHFIAKPAMLKMKTIFKSYFFTEL
jgi:hypothetical protein